MKYLFSFVLVFLFQFGFTQDKFEKESRIKAEMAPSIAQAFVSKISGIKCVKWYAEEGLGTSSYEVKFKLNKKQYSVEFDTLGVVEDVEIITEYKLLPESVRKNIEAFLAKVCHKFKIVRIQRQFIGQEEELINLIQNNIMADDLQTNYELVVKCKEPSETNLFEYLFDSSGKVLSSAKVVFKNSSHLEY
jgi:hypothetical protein